MMDKRVQNEWSTYFQNPEYLEASRIATLKPEMGELMKGWLGLCDGMKVLDVGCGTGEFVAYLAATVKDCEFVGIDLDEVLLQSASQRPEKQGNSLRFQKADALSLPFEEQNFDLVVSHTFFTNIEDPETAMSEMKRVAKKGALIASVTPQSLTAIPFHQGIYPPEYSYYTEYMILWWEVFCLYQKVKPIEGFLKGLQPNLVPQLFAQSGLKNIKMHSTANSFSLSDAGIDAETKKRYIELNNIAELKKFNAFLKLPEFSEQISMQKAQRYVELINIKANTLMKHLDENSIWEWYGGSSLVMTGVNEG